jgi:hypothetical protein
MACTQIDRMDKPGFTASIQRPIRSLPGYRRPSPGESSGDDVDAAIRLIEERFMFVGLTDQYEQSLRAFAALSPWPVNTRIEKRNVAANVSTKNRLLDDPKSRALIEEATQADRQLYTYLKDEFFPAQQQRADAARARYDSRDHTGDHYLASRYYTNLVYRPAVKISRMLKR